MNNRIAAIGLGLALFTGSNGEAQELRAAAPLPDCSATQLVAGHDDENGNFNGMNHSGTLLVVRNISSSACRLASFVHVAFQDDRGRELNVSLDNTPGFPHTTATGQRLPMGHGPVVPPLLLAAGAEATARLRWVSGPVFDHSACVDPASAHVFIDHATIATPLAAHFCGADATHIIVDATRFALDPIYRP